MAHWVGKGKNRRCQSEKGRFLPKSRCGGKRKAKGRKRAKAAGCNRSVGVRVKSHKRRCPRKPRR